MPGQVEDNTTDAEVVALEERARHMGWVDKDKFRGPEDKWVDAATFVKRGEEVLPIVQSQNRKLQEGIDNLRRELEKALAGNKELRESIGALNEFHEENLKEQVARVRAELKEQLKTARKDGDVDKQMELEDQLEELKTKETKADAGTTKKSDDAKPSDKPSTDDPPEDTAFKEWQAKPENEWFGKDRKKTALAIEFGNEVAAERNAAHKGANGMPTAAFYAEVAARVAEFFGEKPTARTSKVAETRTTRSTTDPNRVKGFDDLPDEAKAICRKQAEKLVGPNKVHKDAKSWETKYAQLYWASVGS